MKLLEENTCRTLSDINHSNMILHPPPRVMKIKTKINKWGLVKLKSFCTAKAAGQGAGGDYRQDEKTTLRMGELLGLALLTTFICNIHQCQL